jgi:uncharacterized cupin superfamily protein
MEQIGGSQMKFAGKTLLIMVNVLAVIGSTWSAAGASEVKPAVVPVKLTKADLAGDAFANFASVKTVHQEEGQTWETVDAEIFLSPDRKFDAGVYKSGPVAMDITEPYGVQEFMYFLEGGVILTSADGTRVTVGPGEAVLISADWTGRWDSPDGYRKIYVIYSPHGPIAE